MNRKMYLPRETYELYLLEKILTICGFICLILYLLIKFVFGDEGLAGIFPGVCVASWYIPVLNFFYKLNRGYAIQEDGIFFKYRFLGNKLLYKKINCIIISNFLGRHGISKTPYVTVIGEEQEEILQYCYSITSKRRCVLTSEVIRNKLGAEIGCYKSDVFAMFKKGSATIYNYGFVWNKREMYKLLEGYQGNYYIAGSVFATYGREIGGIVKTYDISHGRIRIIDDSTNGKYIWRM